MRKSKSKMTRLTAIVMAGAMVLGLSACGGKDAGSTTTAAGDAGTTAQAAGETTAAQGSAGAAAGEKVITAAVSTAWDTMMPMNTTSNYTRMICDQIYDRLTQSKADGTYEGRLAKS